MGCIPSKKAVSDDSEFNVTRPRKSKRSRVQRKHEPSHLHHLPHGGKNPPPRKSLR
ncbi:hypothetical protein BD779DRAFT_1487121 [Infundibulicybe gibba]|nr:hypothetical protein BD779DRAFT_1487121 [Infundibulicybe gibba]